MFSIRPQRRTGADLPGSADRSASATRETKTAGRTRRALVALAGVPLACTAVATVAPAPAAAASWPNGQVQITGHGYGHGRGMGQYGAFGYATLYSWSYTQILSHFYGGTTLASRTLPTLTVDLTDFDGVNQVVVTSGGAFTAGGVAIPAGGAALLRYVSAGSYQVATSPGCGKPWSATRPVTTGVVKSSVAATSLGNMLTVCSGSTQRTYRGLLTLTTGGGMTRLVNSVAMEDYLRGVVPRESPASWGDASGGKGMAALQAQAVAARSYAAAQNRYSWARTCDNQNCQVYGGAGLNGVVSEDPRTNTAVTSTAGKVLTNSSGTILSAEFSSSTGGWTAGGTFPAVADLGDVASPNHDWTTTVAASTLGNAFGVGALQSVSTTGNGLGADGGRVLTATVKGSNGTVTVTGNQFRSTLGLMSDWFKVAAPPSAPTIYVTNSLTNPTTAVVRAFGLPDDLPFACDFNGDGTDSAGVYRPSTATFYYRDSFAADAPLHAVKLGAPGDKPVCGDWDGNGSDTVGVYRPSTSRFYLLNTNNRTAGSPLTQVLLGGVGDLPVAGDWDGDKRATVGVFDPQSATFYLVNSLAPGATRLRHRFGFPGDVPIAGDWDGNGTDSFGIYRMPWFATTNSPGGATTYTRYGQAGDRPITGDWNGDHKDTVGIGRDY